MIELKDSNITDILPVVFKDDPSIKALGYALGQATRRLVEWCAQISVYAMIDTASDAVLDLLAVELNTQYYNDTLDIDTKRKLIKGTLRWYTHTGTPAAVQELITAVYGGGELEEWFEYGGEPGYFRITIDITTSSEKNPVTDNIDLILAQIDSVKRASAHLENLSYMIRRAIEVDRKIWSVIYAIPKCGTIKCGTYPRRSTLGNLMLLQTEAGIMEIQSIFETTKCGTIRVGGKLYDATLGNIVTEDVEVEITSDYEIKGLYLAGQLVTGTYPARAVNGYAIGSSTEAGITVTNATEDLPLAGTLITGDASGTETENTAVTVSEEIDVTPIVHIAAVTARKCGTSVCGE